MKKCKFCNMKHLWGSERCSAFGKTCTKCYMRNHTAEACRHRCFKTRSTENYVTSESEKEGVGDIANAKSVVSTSVKMLKSVKTNETCGIFASNDSEKEDIDVAKVCRHGSYKKMVINENDSSRDSEDVEEDINTESIVSQSNKVYSVPASENP